MAFLPPVLKQRYFTATGEPLAGGKIWSYAAGTTTPLPTFTDRSETTQNPNPLILDANGEGVMWLGSNAYKFILMDSSDVVQWTVDNVRSAQNTTWEAIQPLTTKGQVLTHTGVESTPINVGTDGQVLTADSPSTTGIRWALPHPLTTKGDLFTFGTAIAARLPVGTDGQVLRANSATATGLEWQASDPLTTKGDIFVRSASASTRLPVGTNGHVLTADSTTAEGVKWAAASGGGGAENYITNPGAEVDTAGWSLNNITPAPFPSGALLGTPAGLTLTRSTTTPLNGVGEFHLAKDGVNRQGQMLLSNFTVPPKSRAKVLSIRFQYRVLSGTFVNSTSKDTASLGVYIREFDGTNYTWTEPSSWRFLSNSTTIADEFRAEFQTRHDTISADLVFYVGAFATGAWTLELDDIQVTPSTYTYGTPITDWVSYTPTGSWTSTTYTGRWRRVGDSLEGQIDVTANGAATGGQLLVTIPSGLTVDTNKLPASAVNPSGTFYMEDLAVNGYQGIVYQNSSTQVAFAYPAAPASGSTVPTLSTPVSNTAPFTVGSGDYLRASFSVPITGWSSSVQMSDTTDTRVLAVSASKTSGSHTSTGAYQDVASWTSVFDTHGAFNATTGVFTAPVSGYYKLSGQIAFNFNSTGNRVTALKKNSTILYYGHVSVPAGSVVTSSPFSFIVQLNAQETATIQAFQNSGGSLAYATSGENFLNIERISGPNQIAASETVAANYSHGTGQTITTGGSPQIINFESRNIDTHNAVTTGASWKFTAPTSGIYEMSGLVLINSGGGWAAGEEATLLIYKNNVQDRNIGSVIAQATHSTFVAVMAANTSIRLNAGDYIDMRLFQSSGGSVTLNANTVWNWINIKRIGL